MQHYELLFILPGTLGEDEIGPIVSKVKELVDKAGSKDVKIQDLGKSRIAYPMRHIRYGYFQLCQFETEPENVSEIKNKLRLMPDLLRAMIKKTETGGVILEKISAISDVTVREKVAVKSIREDRKPELKEDEHIAAGHYIDKVVKRTKTKVKTETKVENIKLEDIDKKLDELLETSIADV